MKKLIICATAALLLAGCASKPSEWAQSAADKITSTVGTVNEKAKAVQAAALKACSYVPTVTSVVAIFNSGYSADIAVVANAICAAVSTVPLADGPGDKRPRVHGVLVTGRYVK